MPLLKVGDLVRCKWNDNGSQQFVGMQGTITRVKELPSSWPYYVSFADVQFSDNELELISPPAPDPEPAKKDPLANHIHWSRTPASQRAFYQGVADQRIPEGIPDCGDPKCMLGRHVSYRYVNR